MNKEEKQLIRNYNALSEHDQKMLLDFSTFLLSRSEPNNNPEKPELPVRISRPKEESVVAAIKRLSNTFPMINKSGVLDQAAQMMTEHMLNGKDAQLVINELEVLFSEQYEKYCADLKAN